jgi:hypothetical protein
MTRDIYPELENRARCWELMLANPATQEADIRRITVRNQPEQIACETLSQKHPTQKKCWLTGGVAQMMRS